MLTLADKDLKNYGETERGIIRNNINTIYAEYHRLGQYAYDYEQKDKLVKKSIQIIAESMETIMIVTKQQNFVNDICGIVTRHLKSKGYPQNIITMALRSMPPKYKRPIDHTKEESLSLETKESKTVYENLLSLINNIKGYSSSDLTRRQIRNIREHLDNIENHFELPEDKPLDDKEEIKTMDLTKDRLIVANGDIAQGSFVTAINEKNREYEKKTPRPVVDNWDNEDVPKAMYHSAGRMVLYWQQVQNILRQYPPINHEIDRAGAKAIDDTLMAHVNITDEKYRRSYPQWVGIIKNLEEYNMSQVAKMTKSRDKDGNLVGISREYISDHAPQIVDLSLDLLNSLPYYIYMQTYFTSSIQPYRESRVSETRKQIAKRTVNITNMGRK